jgi:hypothetical protein
MAVLQHRKGENKIEAEKSHEDNSKNVNEKKKCLIF